LLDSEQQDTDQSTGDPAVNFCTALCEIGFPSGSPQLRLRFKHLCEPE